MAKKRGKRRRFGRRRPKSPRLRTTNVTITRRETRTLMGLGGFKDDLKKNSPLLLGLAGVAGAAWWLLKRGVEGSSDSTLPEGTSSPLSSPKGLTQKQIRAAKAATDVFFVTVGVVSAAIIKEFPAAAPWVGPAGLATTAAWNHLSVRDKAKLAGA